MVGLNSEFYLLPDMKTGTFFVTNFGPHTTESTYVNQFLQDILLGEEPVYNATEICEIIGSETAMNNMVSDKNVNEMYERMTENIPFELQLALDEYDLVDVTKQYMSNANSPNFVVPPNAFEPLSKLYNRLQNEQNSPSRMIDSYVGTYGNYALKNLTISASEKCETCLFMQYGVNGRFTLYPTNVTDTFMGYNIYPLYGFTPVAFNGTDESGNAMRVWPLYFEWYLPQVFDRDLLMSSAPEPNNDQCVPVDYVR